MQGKNWWKNHWIKNFSMKEAPSEHIIRFTKSKFRSTSGLTIYEIGFGSGRELIFFASQNCYCYGLEVSSEHCLQVKDTTPENLINNINLTSSQQMCQPCKNSVDLLYGLETLHYFESKKVITEYLDTFINYLKINSWCFFSLVHPEHFFCKVSDRINKEQRLFNKNSKNRQGLKFILYETENELIDTFSPYLININIGNYSHFYHDSNYRKFWVVTGQPRKL